MGSSGVSGVCYVGSYESPVVGVCRICGDWIVVSADRVPVVPGTHGPELGNGWVCMARDDEYAEGDGEMPSYCMGKFAVGPDQDVLTAAFRLGGDEALRALLPRKQQR